LKNPVKKVRKFFFFVGPLLGEKNLLVWGFFSPPGPKVFFFFFLAFPFFRNKIARPKRKERNFSTTGPVVGGFFPPPPPRKGKFWFFFPKTKKKIPVARFPVGEQWEKHNGFFCPGGEKNPFSGGFRKNVFYPPDKFFLENLWGVF